MQQKNLSHLELAAFCSQLAMILKSGIPALEGIAILLEDAQSPAEKKMLEQIHQEMTETGMLYPALKATGAFPSYFLQMVEIGEETGTLDDVMSSLSAHYNREHYIAQSIRSALTYPLVMIGMMLLVIVVLLTQVMPIFNHVFRQLGREMTGFSKGILMLGNTLSHYAAVFIGLVVVVALVILWLTKTQGGKKRLNRLGHWFRFTRDIYEKMSACRLAGGMSLTLRSGMTPERGLEFSETLIEDQEYLKRVDNCKERLEEGADLSEALQSSRAFTGMYARMVSIAGRTGVMDEVMSQIADQYEAEVDERVSAFIAMLEPTLVIILSVVVGVILLSVMLPLMGIMSGL